MIVYWTVSKKEHGHSVAMPKGQCNGTKHVHKTERKYVDEIFRNRTTQCSCYSMKIWQKKFHRNNRHVFWLNPIGFLNTFKCNTDFYGIFLILSLFMIPKQNLNTLSIVSIWNKRNLLFFRSLRLFVVNAKCVWFFFVCLRFPSKWLSAITAMLLTVVCRCRPFDLCW